MMRVQQRPYYIKSLRRPNLQTQYAPLDVVLFRRDCEDSILAERNKRNMGVTEDRGSHAESLSDLNNHVKLANGLVVGTPTRIGIIIITRRKATLIAHLECE